MAQYIPKEPLVAWAKETYLCENASMIRKVCFKQLVEYLNTLEVKEVDTEQLDKLLNWWKDVTTEYSSIFKVKEVDLEKVFNDEYSKFSNDTDAMDYAFPIDLADFKDFAKHFFELGVHVSNKA